MRYGIYLHPVACRQFGSLSLEVKIRDFSQLVGPDDCSFEVPHRDVQTVAGNRVEFLVILELVPDRHTGCWLPCRANPLTVSD
jgi:hypothetical protein